MSIDELVKGAFDLHVHTSPDIVPRLLDDLEAGRLFRANGFGGFVIKNHYSPTYDRSHLVNKTIDGIKVLGGVVLNETVGGLNPRIVDVAGRLGALIVWFPTVDSVNERRELLKWRSHSNPPAWAKVQLGLMDRGLLGNGVSIFNEEGRLKPEVDEILELIRQYNMVLATGHLSPEEGMVLVRRAVEKGVRKIIVTHPDFPTTKYTPDQQRELANYGAYLERTYENIITSRVTVDDVVKGIRGTGVEHNILSTDLGQVNNPLPTEGYKDFIRQLMHRGLLPDEIDQITRVNQRRIIYD